MRERLTLVKKAKANNQCRMGSPGLRQPVSMVIVAVALSHANPKAKSRLKDGVKRPTMATRRPRFCLGRAGPLSTPQARSASCPMAPALPSVETRNPGRFQFGLEFCCVFLGRRGSCSIHGAPGLMAKVTPTGGTNPGSGQPSWR